MSPHPLDQLFGTVKTLTPTLPRCPAVLPLILPQRLHLRVDGRVQEGELALASFIREACFTPVLCREAPHPLLLHVVRPIPPVTLLQPLTFDLLVRGEVPLTL